LTLAEMNIRWGPVNGDTIGFRALFVNGGMELWNGVDLSWTALIDIAP